jgi:hypothetical protein
MMSRANTLATMAQQLFLTLGVGLAALILHTSARVRGATSMESADLVAAYVAIAVLGLLSVLYFIRLRPNVGADMSGHRPRP